MAMPKVFIYNDKMLKIKDVGDCQKIEATKLETQMESFNQNQKIPCFLRKFDERNVEIMDAIDFGFRGCRNIFFRDHSFQKDLKKELIQILRRYKQNNVIKFEIDFSITHESNSFQAFKIDRYNCQIDSFRLSFYNSNKNNMFQVIGKNISTIVYIFIE
jgi:hypothetical protein